jgi:hypothetical protein
MTTITAINPAEVNIEIGRGFDCNLPCALKDGAVAHNLTGQTLELKIVWPGGEISKQIVPTNAAGGLFSIDLSPAETRQIPAGRRATYAIQRSAGGRQIPLMVGFVIAIDWPSND